MSAKSDRDQKSLNQRSSERNKRRLGLAQGNPLNFQRLEDRQLLAAITVTNSTDLVSPSADASSITALIANDGGDGISLREAITASNNTNGDDSITFDGSVFTGGANSLIRLTQGELEITDTLAIDASAAIGVTITGDADGDDVTLPGTFITDVAASFGSVAGGANDLLDDNSRVLNFSSVFGDLTLNDLTVTGGRTTADNQSLGIGLGIETVHSGGGIRFFSSRNLTLTGSTVSGNSTSGIFARGGGIYATGDVSLTSSTVSGNSTTGRSAHGGGILAYDGDVSLTSSMVSGNSTSGRYADGGGINATYDVSLTNSTVSGNSTSGLTADGGGIFAFGVSSTSSTVSGNSTTGGVASGGGIFARGGVSLNSSAVTGNSTSGGNADGGGIYARGDVSLTSSTVTGNSTSSLNADGGGIAVRDFAFTEPAFTIENSIVAGNTDNGTAPDLRPDPDSTLTINYSLIGNTIGSGVGATTGTGNLLDVDPQLGPLADNGGPTLTHALLAGSPAIDAGTDTLAVDPNGVRLTADQRGVGFDRIKFGRVDIGAFESDFDAPAIAPSVLSATIDEGGVLARPDLWNTLTVVFDADVTVAAEDLSLVNDLTGGVAVDVTGVGFSYDPSASTATWDFSTLDTPLEAAFYRYRLDADSIVNEGLPLDGDVDGVGGDDFEVQHYVAIPGDANLDGTVNVLGDAFTLVGNLNTTTDLAWADGNFNGDEQVNVLGDGFLLVANLNRDVRPVVLATSFATVLSQRVTPANSRLVAVTVPLGVSEDADDHDNSASDGEPITSGAERLELLLAGSQLLRDDVFGSEF